MKGREDDLVVPFYGSTVYERKRLGLTCKRRGARGVAEPDYYLPKPFKNRLNTNVGDEEERSETASGREEEKVFPPGEKEDASRAVRKDFQVLRRGSEKRHKSPSPRHKR